MPRPTKLSHELKLEIIEKHKTGWKPSAILRDVRCKDRTVTTRNIRYLIDCYQTGSFREVQRIEDTRPAFDQVTGDHLQLIRDTLTDDPTISATDLSKALRGRGVTVSNMTVRKAINAAGWTAAKPRYCQLIRYVNKVKRTDFCGELIHTNEDFDNVIFTDESTIQLHDNKTVCYRRLDGITPQQCRPKHPLKIHLWGVISRRGKTPLLIFEGIMEETFYTDQILAQTLLPFIRRKFPNGHRFVQDNDPKHTSLHARDFMTANNIDWWKWPAESCDLNPIEMIWNMLKRDVAKRQPTTKAELIEYVQDFWRNRLTREVCNNFIDHVYKVVPVVKEINGQASGDLPKKLFHEPSRNKSIQHFMAKIGSPECQQILHQVT